MVKGLYIHIPFCVSKCPYCDFVSLKVDESLQEEYVNILIKEAKLYRDVPRRLRTVYFGGGTPTILKPETISRVINSMDRILDLSGVKEITVECNPETYRYREFRELLRAGVNRLSLGVQSFSEKGLRSLGRWHSVEDSLRAYFEAKEAGFDNVNIDLIFAYPGQKRDDIDIELEWVDRLRPSHLSAYMLTPHRNTPLGLEIISGRLEIPREEELERIYRRLWTGLRALGYRRYEISNWALEGYTCKHNLLYWTLEEFIGIGVSAWGFFGMRRYGNRKNILSYMRAVERGVRPVESEMLLNKRDLFEEFIMLRLRLRKGLPKEFINLIPEKVKTFFEVSEEGVGIKEEYMLLSDEIITEVLLYNSDRITAEVRDG